MQRFRVCPTLTAHQYGARGVRTIPGHNVGGGSCSPGRADDASFGTALYSVAILRGGELGPERDLPKFEARAKEIVSSVRSQGTEIGAVVPGSLVL